MYTRVCVCKGEQESLSVTLKFQSLCQFFSSIDPSGLLGLPASISSPSTPAQSTQVCGLLLYSSLLLAVFITAVTDLWRYGDGVGNTIEENSIVFSLVRMR